MQTPSSITASFPHQHLTPWPDQANLTHYQVLKREVLANVATVHSTAGGGKHGCMGQFMSAKQYANLSTTAYVTPVHPGDWTDPGAKASQEQITRKATSYKEKTMKADRANALDAVITRLIIEAVPDQHLAILRNSYTGCYTGITGRDMLNQLHSSVGTLTRMELKQEQRRVEDLTFDHTAMTVTKIISEIRFFGDLAKECNSAYPDVLLIDMALNIFTNCGIFQQGIRAWDQLDSDKHTLDNLHKHFLAEYNTLKKLTPEGVGGFVEPSASVLNYISQQQRDLEYQQHDTSTVTTEMKSEMAQMREMMLAMQQNQLNIMTATTASATSNSKSRGSKKNNKPSSAPAISYGEQPGNTNNPCHYYCWLHEVNNTHPSYACKKGTDKAKFPNFCPEATFEDRKGGLRRGKFGK